MKALLLCLALSGCTALQNDSERVQNVKAWSCEYVEVIYETERTRGRVDADGSVLPLVN